MLVSVLVTVAVPVLVGVWLGDRVPVGVRVTVFVDVGEPVKAVRSSTNKIPCCRWHHPILMQSKPRHCKMGRFSHRSGQCDGQAPVLTL